jgi:AraC-like DNA-binding protein
MRLAAEGARVVDIALDCGFGDVSNFNHAFRAEFGVSPRLYRRQWGCRTSPSKEPYSALRFELARDISQSAIRK